MTTTHATAAEAIRHSEQYDEIAICEDTTENQETLMSECDDNCSTNGLEDYWADDPDSDEGMIWRVNILTPDVGSDQNPAMEY